ncbi:hypothetical protein D7S89_19535 [Trinickia fusca]|uniref:Uncharacterized protein n=1 Tax=Trinickia fusca TaxID=2419777 RepID=A0A494X5D4_9BURK|nr:hypothetical protein D7S89_19535 [Trinickia fusca]
MLTRIAVVGTFHPHRPTPPPESGSRHAAVDGARPELFEPRADARPFGTQPAAVLDGCSVNT